MCRGDGCGRSRIERRHRQHQLGKQPLQRRRRVGGQAGVDRAGLDDPAATLERLFAELVLPVPPPDK